MTGESLAGPWALIGGRIALPNRIETGSALVIEEGRIRGCAAPDALGPTIPKLDVQGRLITPGLIDLHTHGGLGRSFNEPSPEAFASIVRQQLAHGVTGILATIATAPISQLVHCLDIARQAITTPLFGAQILGVHLEGPYFSSAQRGAQDLGSLRAPDDGSADELLQHYDVIRLMSFAPELPGALELTRRLVALGIVPAAGHSNAREREVVAAIQAGLRHMIHIWSGQSSTVREGPWRVPGLLEVSLTCDDLTVEMIADNRHLPPTLMKLAYKAIGAERLCLVSDATSGAGLTDGARFRMGEMEYRVQDGVGMMLDGSAFGGSTTLLSQMIPILTDVVGVPLVDAVLMATRNPARVLHIQDRKGSLEPGHDADIVVFDHGFTPWRVMVGGRWVYRVHGDMRAANEEGAST